MKYLKRFNEDIESTITKNGTIKPNHNVKDDVLNTIYDKRWENELPEYMVINYHNKLYKFKKDNIMLHSDMIQITFASVPGNIKTSKEPGEIWGAPDTLEFDIYFAKDVNDGKITLDIDVTYGDFVNCEFSIEAPNKIEVVEYSSYNSKFDRSNTVFGLTDEYLQKFINFLNRFAGMKLKKEDFKFLDEHNNYKPQTFPKDVDDMEKVDKTDFGYKK